jgi:limonene 1,2-monooxygenase
MLAGPAQQPTIVGGMGEALVSMRFGMFLAPFHPVGQNPTLALERDLELVEWLDHLGFDEAWFGEHHSAGFEIIASPEIFIATAAARTRRIRLGTGVVSLPYHHPLMVADRMVLLDHLTRGRTMLGVGPGALTSDAYMMGIEPMHQREMMEEALEAILALLASEEPVSMKTSWFTLNEARLHLRPYTRPLFEVAVASTISPAGPRAAGRFGCGLLSIGATSREGFNILGTTWSVMEERAAEFGMAVDRARWRLVAPMHLAETKEQARRDVEFGLPAWLDYTQHVLSPALAPIDLALLAPEDLKAFFLEYGAVIGTPDEAIAKIEALREESGGFGTLLLLGHEWADREATKRSYELIARYVMPRFQGSADSLTASRDWVAENRPTFREKSRSAIEHAIRSHEEEKESRRKG